MATTKDQGSGLLSRAAVLAVQDIKTEKVTVPEWGGDLLVRGLTGTQRDDFEEAMLRVRGKNQRVNLRNFRARLVARSVVDEQGHLLFTDEDIAVLGSKSAQALQRVYRVAERLAGISADEVDELTESLDDDQSEGSGSA